MSTDKFQDSSPASFAAYLAELIDTCVTWTTQQDAEITGFISALQSGRGDETAEQKELMEKIRDVATEDQWIELPRLAEKNLKLRMIRLQSTGSPSGGQQVLTVAEQDMHRTRIRGRLRKALLSSIKEADALNAEINSEDLVNYQVERANFLRTSAENARRQRWEEERDREEKQAMQKSQRQAAESKKRSTIEKAIREALKQSIEEADRVNVEINEDELADYERIKADHLAAI